MNQQQKARCEELADKSLEASVEGGCFLEKPYTRYRYHAGFTAGYQAALTDCEARERVADFPKTEWIKLDVEKHCWFRDGSRFLVALQVTNSKTKKKRWDFDVVTVNCDGEGMSLMYNNGEPYDAWAWEDFEYFCLLDGETPTSNYEGAPDEQKEN